MQKNNVWCNSSPEQNSYCSSTQQKASYSSAYINLSSFDPQAVQKTKDSTQSQNLEIRLKTNKDIEDDISSDTESANNQQLQQLNTRNQVVNILSQIDKLHPTEKKNISIDSLQHDIKSGWIPKTQVTGPIPISFGHQLFDQLIRDKIQQNKILYLGYRPCNTFDLHKKFHQEGKKYPFYQFHLCKSQFLERFFKKYYKDFDFFSNRSQGMVKSNDFDIESIQDDLIFDSQFEGGNLDAVYYEDLQYRLMIRVDSNTKGHCNFYNFKITCKKSGSYSFRIMNISKSRSLYERGMRPYIKVIEKNQKGQIPWQQEDEPGCGKVRFSPSLLNELLKEPWLGRYYSLKFQLELKSQAQYHICYNIPYTYSDLIKNISNFRQAKTVYVSKLGYSLSGVEIPLLTIGQKEQKGADPNQCRNLNLIKENQQQNNKYYVIITGRIHPGETNSSHIVNGLIDFLLKDFSQFRRIKKNLVFKIIPMLNPDGVIIGNTRTGFAGKDLNRKFQTKTEFIFPEVNNLKDYILKLKEKHGKNLLFLIDVHGHSTRKGSFFFGPEYPVLEEDYSKCRLLPKFYAARSQAFRYYSCKFKISQGKQATSRGFFNNHGIRTYTHQTSLHSFYDFRLRKDLPFTQKLLENLGKDLALAIFDYFSKVIIAPIQLYLQIKSIAKKSQKQKQVEKQLILTIPDPVINEQQRQSDKMPSDRADSESDQDDFQDKKLDVFYQKVNENQEYFYEEVMRMLKQKKDLNLSNKKIKRKKLNQIQKEKQKLPQKDNEKIKEKQKEKINQSRKLSYIPKKTLFAEYSKMLPTSKKNDIYKTPESIVSKLKFGVSLATQLNHKRNKSEQKSEQILFGVQRIKLENHSNRIIYSVPNIKWNDTYKNDIKTTQSNQIYPYDNNNTTKSNQTYSSYNNDKTQSNRIYQQDYHNITKSNQIYRYGNNDTTQSNQIYRYDNNDYSKTQLRKKKKQVKHAKVISSYFIEKEQKQLKINKELLQKLLIPSSNSVINPNAKNEVKAFPLKDHKTRYTLTNNEFFPNTDYRIFAAFSNFEKNEDEQITLEKMDKSRSQQTSHIPKPQQTGPQVQTQKEEYLCKKWEKQIIFRTNRNNSFGNRAQTKELKIVEESPFKKTILYSPQKYKNSEQRLREVNKEKEQFINFQQKKNGLPNINLNRKDVVVINYCT